jgi:hypothetical protein
MDQVEREWKKRSRGQGGGSKGYIGLDPAKEPRGSEAAKGEDGKKKGSDGSIRSRRTARRVNGRLSSRVEAGLVAVNG